MDIAETVMQELSLLSTEEKKRVLPRFFKTGSGEYGEGDRFIGTAVPDVRRVAKTHMDASTEELEKLLDSEWHEVRLAALFIMVERCRKGSDETRRNMFDFYIAHTSRINNWDLVDQSVATVIGGYLADKPRDLLYRMAQSGNLWETRMAIVATHAFIRSGELDDTYRLCDMLMEHKHDLIHKACGWMLREAGKRDLTRLYDYVYNNRQRMPRTMLRYAIERFGLKERQKLMERPWTKRPGTDLQKKSPH